MKALLIICSLLPVIVFGQNQSVEKDSIKYIQMTGIVITDSMERVPFTKVYDKVTKRGVIADYYGYYALVVHPGDTIVFTSLGFKRKEYVVSDTMSLDKFTLVQIMKYDTITTDPVEVYPWPSKEQFAEYFVNMDSPFDQIKLAQKRLTAQELAFIGIMLSGDSYSSYSASQQQYYQKMYTNGQGPQNNLLNPAAWNDFIQGIGTGRYQISP